MKSYTCRPNTDPGGHTRTQLEEQMQLNTLCIFMKQGKARLMKHTSQEGKKCEGKKYVHKKQHTDELVSHLKTKY